MESKWFKNLMILFKDTNEMLILHSLNNNKRMKWKTQHKSDLHMYVLAASPITKTERHDQWIIAFIPDTKITNIQTLGQDQCRIVPFISDITITNVKARANSLLLVVR